MDIFDMNEYHVEVAATEFGWVLTEVVPDGVDPSTGKVYCSVGVTICSPTVEDEAAMFC